MQTFPLEMSSGRLETGIKMFLQKHLKAKDGKHHFYWSLTETVRTAEGPRQRLLCYLGELNSSRLKSWRKVVRLFNDEGNEEQLELFPSDTAPENIPADKNIVRVDLSSIRLERAREFGAIYTAWEIWKRLKLDKFWEETLDKPANNTANSGSGRISDVSWSAITAILAINRLCDPGSELSIEEKWYKGTALPDLLHIPEDKINTDRLYRCLDLIVDHKDDLEKHLKKRFGELFEIKYDVILYDLTSTYFEGEAYANPQAKRGHSRDHRSDCKQVVIALVVSEEGFPLTYEIFDGNTADVTTLKGIIAVIERKYGRSGRIWIFDRGIVSEDNLKILRNRKARYLVGTRKDQLKAYEKELLEGDWDKVRDDVEVKLIPDEKEGETYILCRARGRNLKEKAMRETASRKLDIRLNKLAKRIEKGRLKDGKKIERRIGAILGRYPSVADIYEVAFTNGKLKITVDEKKKSWIEAREGAYLLRTNISEKDPRLLWEKYIQLTEAEGSFRALKSELSIRPVFHQLEKRVQAHILVAFLGYALWVTIKHTLKRILPDYSPARTLSILKRIHSGDILLDTVEYDNQTRRTIRLRRIFSPDNEQKTILSAMNISLPKKLSFDLISKCSADL